MVEPFKSQFLSQSEHGVEDGRAIFDCRPDIATVEPEEVVPLEARIPEVVEHPFFPAVLLLNGGDMCSSTWLLPKHEPHELKVWNRVDQQAARSNERSIGRRDNQ